MTYFINFVWTKGKYIISVLFVPNSLKKSCGVHFLFFCFVLRIEVNYKTACKIIFPSYGRPPENATGFL